MGKGYGRKDREGPTNMRENGRLIKNKVMECSHGRTVLFIKATSPMISRREKAK